MKEKRPVWLWALVLWMLALAAISVWRGLVWWRERALLAELGSTLSLPMWTLFAVLSMLCGGGLSISAVGLWWRREWARWSAQAFLPFHFVIIQTYTWLFVQTGLMWERRWVSLILSFVGVGVGVGALSWRKSRKWLSLNYG